MIKSDEIVRRLTSGVFPMRAGDSRDLDGKLPRSSLRSPTSTTRPIEARSSNRPNGAGTSPSRRMMNRNDCGETASIMLPAIERLRTGSRHPARRHRAGLPPALQWTIPVFCAILAL
jgi:hypothetical protein